MHKHIGLFSHVAGGEKVGSLGKTINLSPTICGSRKMLPDFHLELSERRVWLYLHLMVRQGNQLLWNRFHFCCLAGGIYEMASYFQVSA